MSKTAIERVAAAGFVALLAVAVYGYATLPATIATSFASDGTVAYGSKLTLFILPALAVFTYVILRLAEASPTSRINVPIRITAENEAAVRAHLFRLITIVRAELMVGFTCIETQIVASAAKGALSAGFVPVIAAFVAALVLSIGANMVGLRKLA